MKAALMHIVRPGPRGLCGTIPGWISEPIANVTDFILQWMEASLKDLSAVHCLDTSHAPVGCRRHREGPTVNQGNAVPKYVHEDELTSSERTWASTMEDFWWEGFPSTQDLHPGRAKPGMGQQEHHALCSTSTLRKLS
jgi:hypothetical protein